MASNDPAIVIIGAGIVGVATALELVRRGEKVVLMDPAPPGSGASAGNAGCLNPSSIMPVSTPGVLWNVPKWLLDPDGPLVLRWSYLPTMLPWLLRFVTAGSEQKVRTQAQALHALVDGAVDATRILSAGTSAGALVEHQGGLVVYQSQESFDGERLGMELRAKMGIAVEEISSEQLRTLEPDLSSNHVRARFYRGNGHIVNPQRFIAGLAEAFMRAGGEILVAKALSFVITDKRVTGIVTDRGELPAKSVVLAAGAHSRSLAAQLGDKVPLDTERGYHIMIAEAEAGPRLPTMSSEYKIVATPMETGLRVAGTVELAGLTAQPRWERADRLVRLARLMYPGLPEDLPQERVSRWMGFRPSLPDSLPVIGASRLAANAFHAYGHGHVGLTAGARTGRIAADLASGRRPEIDLAPYSAQRF